MEPERFLFKDLKSCSLSDQQKFLSTIKRIERKSFPSSEVFDFDRELRKKNTSSIIAVRGTGASPEVIAYLVYLRIKRLTMLHKLCVVSDQRQNGIGKGMMQFLKARLERGGCDYIQLWVDEDRKAARALYESCNFKQVDRCPDYYGPTRTGLKMELRLDL